MNQGTVTRVQLRAQLADRKHLDERTADQLILELSQIISEYLMEGYAVSIPSLGILRVNPELRHAVKAGIPTFLFEPDRSLRQQAREQPLPDPDRRPN
jgi:hypothetical protein